MLKVDHFRRHVYEYNGIEGSVIPARCKEINDTSVLEKLYSKGYLYVNLNDYCELKEGEVIAMNIEKKEYTKNGVLTFSILEKLPNGKGTFKNGLK